MTNELAKPQLDRDTITLRSMIKNAYHFNVSASHDGHKITILVPQEQIAIVRRFVGGATQLRLFKITTNDVIVKAHPPPEKEIPNEN